MANKVLILLGELTVSIVEQVVVGTSVSVGTEAQHVGSTPMEALKAINFLFALVTAVAAMLSAFILPAEVPALLAALTFPFLTYHIFNQAGDEGGDYGSVLTFVLLFLSWIVAVFAVIYWRYGLVLSSTGKVEQINLLNATYFSVTTWTTLGYGDFVPPPRIRHITSIQAMLGYVGMGIWIATLSHWIAFRTERRREIRKHNRDLAWSLKNSKETSNESSDDNAKGTK